MNTDSSIHKPCFPSQTGSRVPNIVNKAQYCEYVTASPDISPFQQLPERWYKDHRHFGVCSAPTDNGSCKWGQGLTNHALPDVSWQGSQWLSPSPAPTNAGMEHCLLRARNNRQNTMKLKP